MRPHWGITATSVRPRCGAPGASPEPRPAPGASITHMTVTRLLQTDDTTTTQLSLPDARLYHAHVLHMCDHVPFTF